jgi:hypothetical protein
LQINRAEVSADDPDMMRDAIELERCALAAIKLGLSELPDKDCRLAEAVERGRLTSRLRCGHSSGLFNFNKLALIFGGDILIALAVCVIRHRVGEPTGASDLFKQVVEVGHG